MTLDPTSIVDCRLSIVLQSNNNKMINNGSFVPHELNNKTNNILKVMMGHVKGKTNNTQPEKREWKDEIRDILMCMY